MHIRQKPRLLLSVQIGLPQHSRTNQLLPIFLRFGIREVQVRDAL